MPTMFAHNNGYIKSPKCAPLRGSTVKRASDHSRSTPLGLLLLSGMLLTTVLAASMPVSAQVFPTLKMSGLLPPEKITEPTPSAQGHASFETEITVTKPVGPPMRVTITVSIDTGWPAVVSPGAVPFPGAGGNQKVTVAVVVPQATPASSVGVVCVNAIGIFGGQAYSANSCAQVLVKQYFRMTPESQQAFLQTAPGQVNVLSLKIYNQGNGLDTFSVDLENSKELAKQGWITQLSRPTVDNVPPDDFGPITIGLSRPVTFIAIKPGEVAQVRVLIKSDNAATQELLVSKPYVFTIYEKGFFIPGFDLTMAMMVFAVMAVLLERRTRRMRNGSR